MKRSKLISKIESQECWDIVIVGGGASGVGAAVEAASRGYSCLLLERDDFGKGTSSRSTKLVHGGVRYLRQGNFSLVIEALKERASLKKNAPHLVKDLGFIVPIYDWWEGPFYGIGLKLYDFLAGKEGFGASTILSKEETLEKIPNLEEKDLMGGVEYFDGQFDDARLLINLVKTGFEQGATLLNYMNVDDFVIKDGLIKGLNVTDKETGDKYVIKTKVVVNATGVFADELRQKADKTVKTIMTTSRGIHITLDKRFLKSKNAIMVPSTEDGRVIFAVPWLDSVIIGTTDTPTQITNVEPRGNAEEVQYLLSHISKYLENDPTINDVKSVFAGLRPLVKNNDAENTAEISREHLVEVTDNGLVSILGGKWTTYRKMGEDVIDTASIIAGLPESKSVTDQLQIHGYHKNSESFGKLSQYGSDAIDIEKLYQEIPKSRNKLHSDLGLTSGEVIWYIRNEYSRTTEDVLCRRSRSLLLNCQASIELAPVISELIARELGYDQDWIQRDIKSFLNTASSFSASQLL